MKKSPYITVTISDDTHSYTETIIGEEYDAMLKDFQECQSNGDNPQLQGMTFEEYTKNVAFEWNQAETEKLNGKHFIYGWLEGFSQSEDIVGWMLKNVKKQVEVWRTRPTPVYKILPVDFIVIEDDPSAKPWKNYAQNEFKGENPFTYVQIWSKPRWYKDTIGHDWFHHYELESNKYSKDGCILDIQDGKLVRVKSKYRWSISHASHATYAPLEWLKKNCKKCGLKYTQFDSEVKANLYCISKGYPRIGDFSNARPNENHFLPIVEGEPSDWIYEKWGKKDNDYVLLEQSLERIEKGETWV